MLIKRSKVSKTVGNGQKLSKMCSKMSKSFENFDQIEKKSVRNGQNLLKIVKIDQKMIDLKIF